MEKGVGREGYFSSFQRYHKVAADRKHSPKGVREKREENAIRINSENHQERNTGNVSCKTSIT